MSPAARKATAKRATSRSSRPKKNTKKLVGRFAVDFVAPSRVQRQRAGLAVVDEAVVAASDDNPALLRLQALAERDAATQRAARRRRGRKDQAVVADLPADTAGPNWTPLGPLAVPHGQTYGGARILISGRVTAIAPHPTNGDRSSRLPAAAACGARTTAARPGQRSATTSLTRHRGTGHRCRRPAGAVRRHRRRQRAAATARRIR